MSKLVAPLFVLLALSGAATANSEIQAAPSSAGQSATASEDCTWETGSDGAPRYEC